MANVIIGISAVILFIGLALAGTVYLGPHFKEARSNSDAASITSIMSQMAFAVDAKNVREATPAVAGSGADLTPRFLKSLPTNPVDSSVPPEIRASSGATTGSADIVVVRMAANERNRRTCAFIAKQSAQTLPQDSFPPVAAAPQTVRQGCIQLSAAWGGIANGSFLAWRWT